MTPIILIFLPDNDEEEPPLANRIGNVIDSNARAEATAPPASNMFGLDDVVIVVLRYWHS